VRAFQRRAERPQTPTLRQYQHAPLEHWLAMTVAGALYLICEWETHDHKLQMYPGVHLIRLPLCLSCRHPSAVGAAPANGGGSSCPSCLMPCLTWCFSKNGVLLLDEFLAVLNRASTTANKQIVVTVRRRYAAQGATRRALRAGTLAPRRAPVASLRSYLQNFMRCQSSQSMSALL